MADRRLRNVQPRLSDTMAALASVQSLGFRLTPLFREAYSIASSKKGGGSEKVSGGDKSDPTGETASCSCEGGYHSCAPAQIRRAAQAVADAEDSLKRALSKVNGIFEHTQPKEDHRDPAGKYARPLERPLVSAKEVEELKAIQAKREGVA